MSYSIDRDKALSAANRAMKGIDKTREALLENAINREINSSEKWHRRLPWFFKPIDRDEALSRIKAADSAMFGMSEYWEIMQLTYGRAYEAYENIKAACENSSSPTVYIGDKDFDYLRNHL